MMIERGKPTVMGNWGKGWEIQVQLRRPRSKVSGLQGVKALSGAIKYAIAHAYPINTL